MQEWTAGIWFATISGLIIGVIIGYITVRLTKGSIRKQLKTENELKEVKKQLESQNTQLEKHFAESAELFKTLIGDYQKLYRHYAVSSDTLLNNTNKGLFTQQLINAHLESKTDEPPRDYSEGSSGLLKTNKKQH